MLKMSIFPMLQFMFQSYTCMLKRVLSTLVLEPLSNVIVMYLIRLFLSFQCITDYLCQRKCHTYKWPIFNACYSVNSHLPLSHLLFKLSKVHCLKHTVGFCFRWSDQHWLQCFNYEKKSNNKYAWNWPFTYWLTETC